MTGDFNTPSALDWTPAVDAVRGDVHYPVPWPVTRALARAGFTDTYRAVAPRPGRDARHHVDVRLPVPAPRGERGHRPDRLRPGLAGVQVARQRDRRPAGHAATSPTRSTPTPPTTAPSSRPSASRPPSPRAVRLGPERRVVRGDAIAVRYAAPRGEGTDTAARSCAPARPAARRDHDLPPQEASFFGASASAPAALRARPLRRAARHARATASCRAARSGWSRAGARPTRAPRRAGPRGRADPRGVAQRARLPPRLGRHLEGRRQRPLQRLPDVRLHRRDSRRPTTIAGDRRRSRPAATSCG